ncbi:MAG: alpha/beta hydrolase, partial [Acidobacteriaceae bacterium]
ALALLFYQGQWQLLFHPSRFTASTPASAGLAYQEIHFDVTYAGQPRLDAWWIPASAGARYAADTVLYLHNAHGSLSDTLPALANLHTLGLNVFAIDYQGFGRSAGRHPTERLATTDSTAAWTYLTDTRHIPARNLIVFGDGAGAVFAAHVAATFAPAGVILKDPPPPARQIFSSDARARLLPLWLLQNEFLDPSADLARSHAPLLFLARHGDAHRSTELFRLASDPKQFYDLRSAPSSVVTAALNRFLDPLLH